MFRVGLARLGLRHQRLEAHQAHETLHALSVCRASFGSQLVRDLSAPVERVLKVHLVDAPHQRELLGVRRHGLVVQSRTRQVEQLALTTN